MGSPSRGRRGAGRPRFSGERRAGPSVRYWIAPGGVQRTDPIREVVTRDLVALRTRAQRAPGQRPTTNQASSRPDELEQRSNVRMSLQSMAQRSPAVDLVLVPTPPPVLHQHAAPYQVRNNLLDGPLGDSHRVRHIPKASVRVPRQAHQHVRVVAEERPPRRLTWWGATSRVARRHANYYSYVMVRVSRVLF